MKNRFLGNFAFKTLCVVLALICLTVSVAGMIATMFMYQTGFWEHDEETVKQGAFSGYMYQDILSVVNEMGYYVESNVINDSFHRDVMTNFYYEVISNKSDDVLQTNIDEESQKRYFGYAITETYNDIILGENWVTTDIDWAYANLNEEISPYIPPDKSEYEADDKYNVAIKYTVTGVDDENGEAFYRVTVDNITVNAFLPKTLAVGDRFYYTNALINFLYPLSTVVVLITFISLFLFIILMIVLCCAACVTTDSETLKSTRADRFPFDVALLILVAIGIGEIILFYDVLPYFSSQIELNALAVATFVIVDSLLLILYIMGFAARVKIGNLFSRMLIVRFFKFIGRKIASVFKRIGYGFRNLKFVKKTVVSLLFIITVDFFICMINGFSRQCAYIMAFVELLIFIPLVISLAVQFRKIEEGVMKIVNGDFTFKIETKYMFGDFKRMAQELNEINIGMQKALDEKMKSERFKTELITNVSHDLKTPLTSIINYVDLIKKEHVENETVVNYIDVLDRQSSRLKKLIEDLIEASKASTGNIQVNFAPCDAGILLTQAVAEYYEKAENAQLDLIVNTDDSSHYIMADSRLLWRVYDNLLSNICKYAFPGTRVYLSVRTIGDSVVTVFKNISKAKLNISSDELMERFVRGDSSRNTEGSGLGLSIVRSLTSLQHGEFNVSIDGDMYTATVTFGLLTQYNGDNFEPEKKIEEI